MNPDNNLISVVIPAFNEEEKISDCLEFLVAQKTGYIFEVIVVDNNSTDKTVAVATRFQSRLNLRIISEHQQGRGAARAAGFNSAQGQIILSTDADTIAPPNWVEAMVGALKKTNAPAVTGAVMINDLLDWRGRFFNWFWPKWNWFYWRLFGNYFISGFSFAVYKETYECVGGFNPNLQAMEDLDLGFRLNKLGKIVFLPTPAVAFSGRRFKGSVFKGLWEYFFQFLCYYFSGKQKGYLSDVR
ncbi:MAG: hypothetical protein A3J93_02450 [Candidatus Magasanikbacteria bacterium RIFOXYC2_FULL_42_28]|uniref:Glycosyltransferase 2-like domain-containing protein n=1 Tax=Candidatus Magasanikbacteria bacterium RIFOXYC2_FULL_42_28 TaxID=1798704 RepID=A0A1F6NVX0_9BACT|nr:MAG: hypothetical protein A3J93_02450 [Candidatus Magasanikbacteria bacterium RIFOXYC2_FULL_42_28]